MNYSTVFRCSMVLTLASLLAPEVAPMLCAQGAAPTAPTAARPQGVPLYDPNAAKVTTIQGIVVVPRIDDVQRAGVTGMKGVTVKGPAFLQRPDFKKLLSGYLGRPLTTVSLFEMQTNMVKYCRQRGHLVVDAFYPEQNILDGTIQIALLEGVIDKLTVENKGHKWFSDDLILKGVRLKPGDTVVADRLDTDLNWLNRNTYQSLGVFEGSFREVTASFQQGDVGKTDLKLEVKDRCPLRVFGGYDDAGIELVGEQQLFAGFNWANVFGLDQRLNYQYVTDAGLDRFQAHAASYVIPLPWRHELVFFGAYAHVEPDYALIGLPTLSSKGDVYQASARYTIPLPHLKNYDHEISGGFDFKRTDTPVVFGSVAVFATEPIEVDQFVLSYNGVVRDTRGQTAFSVQGVYSPGGLTSRNNDTAFNQFSPGTTAAYAYGDVEIRREFSLPHNCSLYARALGQLADAKLTPSETFGLGGYSTVRGYDERTVIGDDGWLLTGELRSPKFPFGLLGMKGWIQILAFSDYGAVITRNPDPALSQVRKQVLLSVGGGVRYQLAENFRVRIDYGYQLDREYLSNPSITVLHQPRARGHVGVEISF